MDILKRVYWPLGRKHFPDDASFVAEVTRYNEAIAPGEHQWRPDQVVAPGPIRVRYEAFWKNTDDKLDLTIGTPGMPLTMGGLLFELHNRTSSFFGDNHFFEGLSSENGTDFVLSVGT